MLAESVFKQNNGDVTKAYYAEMNRKGYRGMLAVALFRAQKRSVAAKRYRKGPGYKTTAYDVKNWSIEETIRILTSFDFGFSWGWGIDYALRNKRDPHHHILYVDLPTGQCSFHTATRLAGPDYTGSWNPGDGSEAAILRFCDSIYVPHHNPTAEEREAVKKEAAEQLPLLGES